MKSLRDYLINRTFLHENESLFVDKWHDTEDVLPETGENVWFIYNGVIEVGVYEEEQELFCMADYMGVPLKEVRQWKYVGSEKIIAAYPREREIIAVDLPEFECLALGHYTSHYEDPETGDDVRAVLLDGIYHFEGTEDMSIAWTDVFGYYEFPELPLKVIEVCGECEECCSDDESEDIELVPAEETSSVEELETELFPNNTVDAIEELPLESDSDIIERDEDFEVSSFEDEENTSSAIKKFSMEESNKKSFKEKFKVTKVNKGEVGNGRKYTKVFNTRKEAEDWIEKRKAERKNLYQKYTTPDFSIEELEESGDRLSFKMLLESQDFAIISSSEDLETSEVMPLLKSHYSDRVISVIKDWINSPEYGKNDFYLMYEYPEDAIIGSMGAMGEIKIFAEIQGREGMLSQTTNSFMSGKYMDKVLSRIESTEDGVVFYNGEDIPLLKTSHDA